MMPLRSGNVAAPPLLRLTPSYTSAPLHPTNVVLYNKKKVSTSVYDSLSLLILILSTEHYCYSVKKENLIFKQ